MSEETWGGTLDGLEDQSPVEARNLPPAEPNQCPFYACRKQYTNQQEVERCVLSHLGQTK